MNMFKKVKSLPILAFAACCLAGAVGNNSAKAWTKEDCKAAQNQCNKKPAFFYSGCHNFSAKNNSTPFYLSEDDKTGFTACYGTFQTNSEAGCQAGHEICVQHSDN